MAIIDLVRWAPQGNQTIYAFRFPETNLSTYTQLIVQESQEAILFSKGQIVADDKAGNLQKEQAHQTVYVEFGIKLTKKDLQDIPGARKIESFNEGWLIESDEDVDLRKEIAQFAQTKQWLVLTLKVERKSLEDVFKQLTK